MSAPVFSIEDKINALDMEIKEMRDDARRAGPGTALHRQYEVLKAVTADLRARQQLPRNNALGALEREIIRMKAARLASGAYQPNHAMEMANVVVSKWPVISQALERFGEESAE